MKPYHFLDQEDPPPESGTYVAYGYPIEEVDWKGAEPGTINARILWFDKDSGEWFHWKVTKNGHQKNAERPFTDEPLHFWCELEDPE